MICRHRLPASPVRSLPRGAASLTLSLPCQPAQRFAVAWSNESAKARTPRRVPWQSGRRSRRSLRRSCAPALSAPVHRYLFSLEGPPTGRPEPPGPSTAPRRVLARVTAVPCLTAAVLLPPSSGDSALQSASEANSHVVSSSVATLRTRCVHVLYTKMQVRIK